MGGSSPLAGPAVVFGPRSRSYDFGPGHPLTTRRFGPGIDLLRAVGAEPAIVPEPAGDGDLLRIHLPAYLEAVRRFSENPDLPGAMGIGLSDNPAFAGMHEAAAAVAGGSLRGIEAILRGEVEHAHHPGGGLHHAMPGRASGFCIYNDAALAVVRARADGLRVLYVDLDVHHGDGVQAMTYEDPGTLTLSLHEDGRYLFPGTGSMDEVGEGPAAGTSVNMPFEPFAGDASWVEAIRALLPTLAAVFGPDVVVSQHGADSHAWDPLAHLRVTTAAHAEAARLLDAVAHRWAAGRWLATGGGGYDAYRVVPRTWALTWLAGAHRPPDEQTPAGWRARWEDEAAEFGTPGMPVPFIDPPNAGRPVGGQQVAADEASRLTLARIRRAAIPRLVREAEDRGWWAPALSWAGTPLTGPAAGARATGSSAGATPGGAGAHVEVTDLGAAQLDRLRLAPRMIAPFDPHDALDLLGAAAADGARVIGAVEGDLLVGVAVAAPVAGDRGAGGSAGAARSSQTADESLLAVGVAPQRRGLGIGGRLIRALVEGRPAGAAMDAVVNVAERDVVEPLDVARRQHAARHLLAGAGFEIVAAPADLRRDDPWVIAAMLAPR